MRSIRVDSAESNIFHLLKLAQIIERVPSIGFYFLSGDGATNVPDNPIFAAVNQHNRAPFGGFCSPQKSSG